MKNGIINQKKGNNKKKTKIKKIKKYFFKYSKK